jgi:hypothetical protein
LNTRFLSSIHHVLVLPNAVCFVRTRNQQDYLHALHGSVKGVNIVIRTDAQSYALLHQAGRFLLIPNEGRDLVGWYLAQQLPNDSPA